MSVHYYILFVSECEIKVHPYVSQVAQCSNEYTSSTELREPFNLNQTSNFPGGRALTNAFIYQTSQQTNSLTYWGKFATYGGGGFVISFKDNTQYVSQLANLIQNNWLDKHTRAIFGELTVYNVNMNLFTTIKIIIEAATSGGFSIYDDIQTCRLYNYVGGWGAVIFGVQIIWLLTVVYTIVKEVMKISKQGRKYFHEFWNVVELSNVAVAILCIITFMIKVSKTIKAVEDMHASKGRNSHQNYTIDKA